MENLEVLVAGIVLIIAAVVAALHQFRDWTPKQSANAILWLLLTLAVGEFAIRARTLVRLDDRMSATEKYMAELAHDSHPASLILSPEEIWKKASALLSNPNTTILDSTSIRNSDEYEEQIALAQARGASIRRILCIPQTAQIGDYIHVPNVLPFKTTLYHVPNSNPFDFLVVETGGQPSALLGLKDSAETSAYKLGIQVNDRLGALHVKQAMNDQLMQLATQHMVPGNGCPVCNAIAALK